jgi:protease-4
MSDTDNNWERQALEKVALAAVQEQRKSRQWGIFFKSLTFLYLFILLFAFMGWMGESEKVLGKHTALIDMQGVISSEEISADIVVSGLQSAFEDKHTKGVILRINSPGGSPVQAGQIYDEIKRLRAKHPSTPLFVVVDDICASGGYYVAAAADKIFVDKASIVGSIGVLMDGFGFTKAMEKLGVERRLLTAGENKGFLDPFLPADPEQEAYAKKMLEEVHQQFIDVVRKGRGKRLKETPDMFSGLIWSGAKSIELGLADAYGSADYVAREVIKAENIIDFTPRDDLASRLADKLGIGMAKALKPLISGGSPLH